MLRTRRVHDGVGFSVYDVACRAPASAAGREEASSAQLEVAVALAGSFVVHQPQGETLILPGRAVFFAKSQGYRVAHPRDGGDRCLLVALNAARRASLEEALGRTLCTNPVSLPGHAHALACVLARGEDDALLRDEIVARLLVAVGNADPATRGAADERLAQRAEDYLVARYSQRLRLADVAGAAGCSEFHLARIFRRARGVSLHRFLVILRLRAAVTRILGGDSDLTRVAVDAGFYDHAHFTNGVRRELGVAPSELRKKGAASRILQAWR